MAQATTRPRLRQLFPDGGHLDLSPAPGTHYATTQNPATAARLALALLIARHGTGPGTHSKTPYTYGAIGEHGQLLADQDDQHVRALAAALHGTDCGLEAQHAALAATGL